MFKLDDDLLKELGLGSLPVEEKNRMLAHIYETLEMRVGMKLAEQMTNEQLDEFEGFIDRNDEAGALKWLETNFPNYKQVVADQLEMLKGEVKTAAPQIVSASQQALAAGGYPAQAQPQPGLAPQQPMPQQPALSYQQQGGQPQYAATPPPVQNAPASSYGPQAYGPAPQLQQSPQGNPPQPQYTPQPAFPPVPDPSPAPQQPPQAPPAPQQPWTPPPQYPSPPQPFPPAPPADDQSQQAA
jgi:hypothetical protein